MLLILILCSGQALYAGKSVLSHININEMEKNFDTELMIQRSIITTTNARKTISLDMAKSNKVKANKLIDYVTMHKEIIDVAKQEGIKSKRVKKFARLIDETLRGDEEKVGLIETATIISERAQEDNDEFKVHTNVDSQAEIVTSLDEQDDE